MLHRTGPKKMTSSNANVAGVLAARAASFLRTPRHVKALDPLSVTVKRGLALVSGVVTVRFGFRFTVVAVISAWTLLIFPFGY
jgi:hypothetical protein